MTLLGPAMAFFTIAIVPAVCEELLFRGFLLGGLSAASRKWPAILASACVFGIFHFFLSKFAVTATLGVVLGYLCWRSKSILPGMIAHALNNGLAVLFVFQPKTPELLGIVDDNNSDHLPITVLLAGSVMFVAGCIVASRGRVPQHDTSAPIPIQEQPA